MNANLSERFRRGRFPNTQAAQTSSSGHGFDLSLNLDIREYVQKQDNIKHSSDKNEWLSQPEFPSVDELENEMPGLLVNKIEAPYKSKDKYLKTHYGLQREDAVGSLRDALQDFRSDPTTNDTHKFSVYDQV
jgi:helicase required for RNAi-mediated heterochromatin assembly 1